MNKINSNPRSPSECPHQRNSECASPIHHFHLAFEIRKCWQEYDRLLLLLPPNAYGCKLVELVESSSESAGFAL